MKFIAVTFFNLILLNSFAFAEISRTEINSRYGYRRIYTNTPAVCDARLTACLGEIIVPPIPNQQFYEELMYCYEEDTFCRESYIEEFEIDENVLPPPPEEPPPGWDSPAEPADSILEPLN